MKKIAILLSCAVALLAQCAYSQTGGQEGDSAVVSDIGPHSRTWKITPKKGGIVFGRTGDVKRQAERKVFEIGTGLNYLDGQRWTPSVPSFEEFEGAFVASRVQHKVRLASDNINVAGAVSVTTPSGDVLDSTPVAIALFDAASGNLAIIANITDCAGVLVSSNQVVYANAFSGGSGEVSADIVYTLDRGAFSQDVVLTSNIDPTDWGFPAETTRIQVLTEFYQAPHQYDQLRHPIRIEQDRNRRAKMDAPDFIDESIGFGEFVLGPGKTYTITETNTVSEGAVVAKEFVTIDGGRRFLVESIEYSSVSDNLKLLPAKQDHAQNVKRTKAKKAYASIPSLKNSKTASAVDKTQKVAFARAPKHAGVAIDYHATIGGSLTGSQTFNSGCTYYVSSPVICNGAVTIQGGAVFKFKTDASITVNGPLTCQTGPYNPAVFTALVDDTSGECIQAIDPQNYIKPISPNGYANPALSLVNPSSPSLNNMRFCYCKQAINISGTLNTANFPLKLLDSQIIKSVTGITITITGAGCGCGCSAVVNALNTLFDSSQSVVNVPSCPTAWNPVFNFTQCSLGKTIQVLSSGSYNNSVVLSFNNSILSSVTNLSGSGSPSFTGANNGFYLCPSFGSSAIVTTTSPFQPAPVGAGAYYLADGSSFKNAGQTSIDATALNSIRSKTTVPPLVLGGSPVINNLTLRPRAQKDSDAPDLGYHYEIIDFIVDSLPINNAVVTITNGTTIATYWDNGFWLQDGAGIVSEGSPQMPNRFIDYIQVQEQPLVFGSGGGCPVNCYRYNRANGAPAQFRFTEFRHLDGGNGVGRYCFYLDGGNFVFRSLNVQDCLFKGGASENIFTSDGEVVNFKNNVFDGESIGIGTAVRSSFCNNLVRGGGGPYFAGFAGVCTIENNAFDHTEIADFTDGGSNIAPDHNAYIVATNDFPAGAGDIVVSSFTYTSGPLGNYYQATNQPTTLTDKGIGTAAQAGLYHYTTITNLSNSLQIKDSATVDIGFHYVATDANGVPTDTDGDGLADYLEDRNGDGDGSNDITSWNTYNSINAIDSSFRLSLFTPVKP